MRRSGRIATRCRTDHRRSVPGTLPRGSNLAREEQAPRVTAEALRAGGRVGLASPPDGATAQAVAVGGTLDVMLRPGNLAGGGVTYTIAPQPLPANMTFNRGTGELVFAPAPGQDGPLNFTVTASDGTRTASELVPIAVTAAARPSTEVAGQVVDEVGRPLAHVPVMAGPATTTTDASSRFTLRDLAADAPGPLTVDGPDTAAGDRMMLMAPLDRFLGHAAYADVTNVVPRPIVLPRIDAAHARDFRSVDTSQAIDVTNPVLPGAKLSLPAGSATGAGGLPFTGTIALTSIPAALVPEALPPGVVANLLEVDAVGLRVDRPVQLSLPNTAGYKPGTELDLWSMNMHTGGDEVVGQVVVSPDGKTMTTTAGIMLASAMMPASTASASPLAAGAGVQPLDSPGLPSGESECYYASPMGSPGQPVNPDCGWPTDANQLIGDFVGGGGYPGGFVGGGGGLGMASDADLMTGAYVQDHALVTYQSQGQDRGLDLQYSSLQADPLPVVQFEPTTQVASDAAYIDRITAQLTVGGVIQGAPVAYNIPLNTLGDGQTYRIPLQFDATQLATGVYRYAMTVTQHYSDGTSVASDLEGDVDVVNRGAGPLGKSVSEAIRDRVIEPRRGGRQ